MTTPGTSPATFPTPAPAAPGGLSAANVAANKRTLTGDLVQQMGLDPSPGNWTYDQRIAFNKAFAAYITAHPASFSALDHQTARVVTAEHPGALSDTSVAGNLSAFGGEVVNNVVAAGAKVANIGTGVLDTLGLAGKLLPFIALIVGGIYLYSFAKSKNANLPSL